MTQVETELLAALYVLYLHDAVYWMSSADVAWTRSDDAGGWTRHEGSAKSFTLLGHRAVVADPLLLRPGYVSDREGSATVGVSLQPEGYRARRRVARRLESLVSLRMQCRLQGFLLLVILPWVLVRHATTLVWTAYGVTLAMSHVLLMFSVWELLPKDGGRGRVLAPVVLNPLGAVRVTDPLGELWYRRFVAGSRRM